MVYQFHYGSLATFTYIHEFRTVYKANAGVIVLQTNVGSATRDVRGIIVDRGYAPLIDILMAFVRFAQRL